MKILFIIQHPGYVRNFESVIRETLARGHQVVVAFNKWSKSGEGALIERMVREEEGLSMLMAPERSWEWLNMARQCRGLRDYLRYSHPQYRSVGKLRERAVEKTIGSKLAAFVERLPGVRNRRAGFIRLYDYLLRKVEEAIPSDPGVLAFLNEQAPDLVMVTPLIIFQSDQVDYVKGARKLGIPCTLGVASWDNLTNKGLIRVQPDAVFVWNDMQRREAVALHGTPRDRVVITGAHTYDKWSDQSLTMGRDQFLGKVDLPLGGDFILYVCSSPFIAADMEGAFVRRWLAALRSSHDERVRNISVLVRPHPQNAAIWENEDLSDLGPVSVYPRAGANPINADAKSDFYDSMAHSLAVIGINTSAQIEAAVVRRPVMTIETPEFASTQEGTLHYRMLIDGGLLVVASDLGEHVEQVAAVLRDPAEAQERVEGFTASFVHPLGSEQRGAPVFADALEAIKVRGPVVPYRRAGAPWRWIAEHWLKVLPRRKEKGRKERGKGEK